MWQTLTVLAVVATAALHFWWRRKFLRAQATARLERSMLEERVQSQALQSDARQQAVFNSMIEGLLLLDVNGRIQLANRTFADLFDIPADVRGKTVLEVVRQHELIGVLEKVAVEKQLLDYELKLGGRVERWLQINATAFHDQHGAFEGTILVFHDLTRLKQLERTREEFVANVSHELRTPLSLIKGYVETLLDGARDNPDVAIRFLQTIQRNAERLQFLIEDLLTISELEAGRLTMNLQTLQLRPLADKVIEDFRPQAQARGTTLNNDVPELDAHADGDRLQQVLANLVANAVKYGRNEGTIRIGARIEDERTIQMWVQDDGPGMPADALDRVFERFYRVDKARSREQGGTGLGLAIVKHIVQSHGGRVWASSELGKGATFCFTLPTRPPLPMPG